jgi:hypothetical protein
MTELQLDTCFNGFLLLFTQRAVYTASNMIASRVLVSFALFPLVFILREAKRPLVARDINLTSFQGEGREGVETPIHRASPSVMRVACVAGPQF